MPSDSMSSIICVTFVGTLLATTRSRFAMGLSPSIPTPLTTIFVTRISPGSDPSRSANKRDHENRLRSTSPCAYFNWRFWSGVRAVSTAFSFFFRVSSCFCKSVTSRCVAAMLVYVLSDDCAINNNATIEVSATTAVTVHGRTRLRKGLLARLSLVLINSNDLSKRIHGVSEPAQTASTRLLGNYTLRDDEGCGKSW